MNVDHDPLSIDVVLLDCNIRLRLTSNNISAIQLSRLIRIYTKFDKRVLPLFRLFRYFSKVRQLSVNRKSFFVFLCRYAALINMI